MVNTAQEPYVWELFFDNGKHEGFTSDKGMAAEYGENKLPLYTSPPAREPLSEDELSLMAWNDCSDDWNDLGNRTCWLDGYEAGARAIEQAHGIGVSDD